MNFKNERLMMSKEEARNRAKELLNENQVDLITKYMFLEQRYKKQKEIIDKAIKHINKYESIKAYYEYIDEDGYDEYNCNEDFKKESLDILNEVTNNE